MPAILVALTNNAYMRQRLDSEKGTVHRRVDYILPRNPEIVSNEVKQSPRFWLNRVRELRENGIASIANEDNPLMAPSAGSIAFFTDGHGTPTHVALNQKDAGSPRDKFFRVPRNGYARSPEDWITMKHLRHESFEEGIFLTRDGDLLLPEDRTDQSIIEDVVSKLLPKVPWLRVNGDKKVDMQFGSGYDTLHMSSYDNQRELTDTGSISWTPETGFNFIKPLIVDYPVEELMLIDGEEMGNGTPLLRDVCVIPLEHLAGKLFGAPIRETVHRSRDGKFEIFERDDAFLTDKVPRSLLCQFEQGESAIYPMDWMDESYEFLSQLSVCGKAYQNMAFSEIERKTKAPQVQVA